MWSTFLTPFPISVNSQIITSLNSYQEAELGTGIAQRVDSTLRFAVFRKPLFYFVDSPLLH